MARIFYVHWHLDEAQETVRELRAAGHSVNYHWSTGEEAWRLVKDALPDALVVSLGRLPSHGRAVAAATTDRKQFAALPVIFVGGPPDKVAVTRRRFPHATFCSAAELDAVLAHLKPFIPPDSATRRRKTPAPNSDASRSNAASSSAPAPAGYSGTPLPQKLGIKPTARVAFVNAPADFDRTLGELPSEVVAARQIVRGESHDVIVYFARSRRDLAQKFAVLARRLNPAGGLWISWPKKASAVATDLTEDAVREIGLAAGLVDNKVCAIDATWSGLRFVYRVKDRPKSKRES